MFTLGRNIDIHYPTNRLILMLTAVTAVISFFISGNIMTGIKIGGTIFLTWALSRELDPKREYGAFVSVVLALYSFFVSFEIALMEVLFFMLILRLISTTCGKQPTWFDAGTILALASYLSYSLENPAYLLLAFIGLFISGTFKRNQMLHRILSLLAGGSGGYLLSMLFLDASLDTPILSFPFLLILIILYSSFSFFDRNKGAKIYDDQQNEISPLKILKSQLFFAVSLLFLTLVSDLEVGNMILYSASLAGLTIYGIFSKITKFEG